MTKVKKAKNFFTKEDGWKDGDVVRCIGSSESALYNVGDKLNVKEKSGYLSVEIKEGLSTGWFGEFVLVSSEEDDEWYEWEEVYSATHHSRYYSGCDWEFLSSYIEGRHANPKFRVKKPKRVSTMSLKGTVELDSEGRPRWDTYKPEESK